MKPNIAFIGVGNMASAIIKGIIQSGYPAECIIGTSRTPEKRDSYQVLYGIRMLADNSQAVAQADVVILCVKPVQMQEVVEAFAEQVRADQLFLSVAAGISLSAIQSWLSQDVAIVRSMPNTPAQVGAGVVGLVANQSTSTEQKSWVSDLFATIGESIWVENEEHMHTVTALSGSAPAYFFRFLEAMIKSGQAQGLDESSCKQLAAYTMLGAARMVTELDESIAQMRKNITSPNGTTEQALLSFEASDIDKIVDDAMKACIRRSQELASQFTDKTNTHE